MQAKQTANTAIKAKYKLVPDANSPTRRIEAINSIVRGERINLRDIVIIVRSQYWPSTSWIGGIS
jgi:hypothetical protein